MYWMRVRLDLLTASSLHCARQGASGRFVKQEQWEHWRDKRKLVSGSKHRGRIRREGGPGVSPPEKI